jgi:hypothetical protein
MLPRAFPESESLGLGKRLHAVGKDFFHFFRANVVTLSELVPPAVIQTLGNGSGKARRQIVVLEV